MNVMDKLKYENFRPLFQLGSVAGPVIQATGRLESEDGLRTGVLLYTVSCWTGVRTKLGVNMANIGEPELSRLTKEMRIGPEVKTSSSKRSRRAVVGSRRRVGSVQ